MVYRLANKFGSYRNAIAVVGCGGTGGFAAEGICRLLAGRTVPKQLVLIDGDRVEERNLGRQNFCPEDLGNFKAQALAERLARRYRLPVAYSVSPLEPKEREYERGPLTGCALVIGCVDNAPARAAIVTHITLGHWWLDAGNGAEFGQVLIGNARAEAMGRRDLAPFDQEKGLCHALPLPTQVRPELLVPAPRPRASCAAAVAAGEQGPTINQAMAVLVVEAVRLLLEGSLTWWQGYLELNHLGVRTVEATPEGLARLIGIKEEKLLVRRERR